MRYYSFAGETRGQTDPDEIFVVDKEDGECNLNGCTKANCRHTVILWSGEEYSKDHTWIACGEKYTTNLNDAR